MATAKPNFAMRMWLVLTWCASPLLRLHLRKRVSAGKEDPERWREKLGETDVTRPAGTLVWLHAVGLGEVLALRGLIHKLNALEPSWHFLITSGTRASAQVLAMNMPPQSIHQFLPIDTPQAAARFLAHWRPNIAIWAEQELWPGLVYQTDVRGIPLAMVNARLNTASFAKRMRARAIYENALSRFAIVSAQEQETAGNLRALGAIDVRTDGSLKTVAPDLVGTGIAEIKGQLGDRFVWVLASSHIEDEAIALAAHRSHLAAMPDAILIIAPRDVARGAQIAKDAQAFGLTAALRSEGQTIKSQVYVADTFGELGLWYRIASVALIGGTFGETQGHNPWEAAQLSIRILFGPKTANFRADFAELKSAGCATEVTDANDIVRALGANNHLEYVHAASDLLDRKATAFDDLVEALISLSGDRHV